MGVRHVCERTFECDTCGTVLGLPANEPVITQLNRYGWHEYWCDDGQGLHRQCLMCEDCFASPWGLAEQSAPLLVGG